MTLVLILVGVVILVIFLMANSSGEKPKGKPIKKIQAKTPEEKICIQTFDATNIHSEEIFASHLLTPSGNESYKIKGLNFVAVDFETANELRSSICQIGLAFVVDGEVVETRSCLIKPQNNHYSDRNTDIHGITSAQTAKRPEFNQIWNELKPLIDGKYVVAHNANFDMSCLKSVLDLYGLDYPDINIACSYILSKAAYPILSSYKLTKVAESLRISVLTHHDAEDDAFMCALIMRRIFADTKQSDFRTIHEHFCVSDGCMKNVGKVYLNASESNNVFLSRQAKKDIPKSPELKYSQINIDLSSEEDLFYLKNSSIVDDFEEKTAFFQSFIEKTDVSALFDVIMNDPSNKKGVSQLLGIDYTYIGNNNYELKAEFEFSDGDGVWAMKTFHFPHKSEDIYYNTRKKESPSNVHENIKEYLRALEGELYPRVFYDIVLRLSINLVKIRAHDYNYILLESATAKLLPFKNVEHYYGIHGNLNTRFLKLKGKRK